MRSDQRKAHMDCCSSHCLGMDLQFSTEFADPFAHAGYSYSCFVGGGVQVAQALLGDSLAVVGDLQPQGIGLALEANRCRGRARVPVHVGETLLQNSKKNEFAIPGRAFHFFRDLELNIDTTSTGEAFDEPACSRGDASLIEQRRMQKVRSCTDFLQSFIGERVEI